MKKKALGKGLKAFLPEDYGILKEERYIELDIEKIKPNPLQPRLNFKSDSIDELARSIQESGVLQPIVVTAEGGHYKIILGERRWRAAQKIGLKKIPALIRSFSKDRYLEISLIENLQREDLNPLEIALAYQRMNKELNYTQQEIADRVGKDRASVANYLRLLKLPKDVQDFLADDKISMGHARALIPIEDSEQQIALARLIHKNNLSVRDVEKRVNKIKAMPKTKEAKPIDPDLLALQEEFLKALGTKVSISGNQNRGIVKIYYFSLDELNQIYEKIKGVGQ